MNLDFWVPVLRGPFLRGWVVWSQVIAVCVSGSPSRRSYGRVCDLCAAVWDGVRTETVRGRVAVCGTRGGCEWARNGVRVERGGGK